MGKFDGILFCSDYDGTLADYSGNIPQNNLDAIEYFQENGGIFTLVTGRPCNHLLKSSKKIKPKTHVIACNGAVLFDWKNETLLENIFLDDLNDDVYHFFMEELSQCKALGTCSTDNVISTYVRKGYANDFLDEKTIEVETISDIIDHAKAIDEPIQRIFIMQDEKHTAQVSEILTQKYGENHQVLKSWSEGVEILPLGASKGNMIKHLVKNFHPEVHTIACAGDFFNDISMFKIADYSFVDKNSPEEVKRHAMHGDIACIDGIIAHAINKLEKLVDNPQ